MKSTFSLSKRRGQALTEYVILLMVLAGILFAGFKQFPVVLAKLEAPLKNQFRRVYKYGDPKTCGYQDEGIPECDGVPERHPRVADGANFRLFGRGGL